jgi:hypothetical protein
MLPTVDFGRQDIELNKYMLDQDLLDMMKMDKQYLRLDILRFKEFHTRSGLVAHVLHEEFMEITIADIDTGLALI